MSSASEPSFDGPDFNKEVQRWYDADPAFSRALSLLREAPDKYQAQIALNIIKIIVEHRIEGTFEIAPESLEQRLSGFSAPYNMRRWYDVNETLRSAMEMLKDCPEDLQANIIPTIARMIEKTLKDYVE